MADGKRAEQRAYWHPCMIKAHSPGVDMTDPHRAAINVARQKLHEENALLTKDLSDAYLTIGTLFLTNVLALVGALVATGLLIWN